MSVAACGGLIAPVEDVEGGSPASGTTSGVPAQSRTDASSPSDGGALPGVDSGADRGAPDASAPGDASISVDAAMDGVTSPSIPWDTALMSTASTANDVLLVTATPMFFALDASHVYWTDWTAQAHAVQRVSKQGGTIETLASASHPAGIAVDGTNVYWADATSIRSVPVEGGPVAVLVTGQTPQVLVKTDDALYWTNLGNGSSVMKAGLDGSNPHAIATCLSGESPIAVAVRGNVVTWTTTLARVVAAGVEGENPHVLDSPYYVWGVSTDGTSVFFVGEDGFSTGELRSIGASGSPSTTMARARNGGCRATVAFDDDSLWVAWCMQPGVVKRSRTTGAAAALGIDATDIAIDATDLYWMESVGGVGTYIKKRPK